MNDPAYEFQFFVSLFCDLQDQSMNIYEEN